MYCFSTFHPTFITWNQKHQNIQRMELLWQPNTYSWRTWRCRRTLYFSACHGHDIENHTPWYFIFELNEAETWTQWHFWSIFETVLDQTSAHLNFALYMIWTVFGTGTFIHTCYAKHLTGAQIKDPIFLPSCTRRVWSPNEVFMYSVSFSPWSKL